MNQLSSLITKQREEFDKEYIPTGEKDYISDAILTLVNAIKTSEQSNTTALLEEVIKMVEGKIVHSTEELKELNRHLDSRLQQTSIDVSSGFIEAIETVKHSLQEALDDINKKSLGTVERKTVTCSKDFKVNLKIEPDPTDKTEE